MFGALGEYQRRDWRFLYERGLKYGEARRGVCWVAFVIKPGNEKGDDTAPGNRAIFFAVTLTIRGSERRYSPGASTSIQTA